MGRRLQVIDVSHSEYTDSDVDEGTESETDLTDIETSSDGDHKRDEGAED